jgi:hypothetical protein
VAICREWLLTKRKAGFKVSEREDSQAEGAGMEKVQLGETVVDSGREDSQGEEEDVKQDNRSGVTVLTTESER